MRVLRDGVFKQFFRHDPECIFPCLGGDLVQLAVRGRVDALSQQFLGALAPVSGLTERYNGIKPETERFLLAVIPIGQTPRFGAVWGNKKIEPSAVSEFLGLRK